MESSLHSLDLVNVSKIFSAGSGTKVTAIDGVDCTINSNEFAVVVGANGSGKSTFLKLLSGQEMPDTGTIQYSGDEIKLDWSTLNERKKSDLIKVIEQDPTRGSVGTMTLEENLSLAQLAGRRPSILKMKRNNKTDVTNGTIFSGRTELQADELSYGQRQLFNLELMRNLDYEFLLLDEPTASLDRSNSKAYMENVDRVAKSDSFGIVLVTHDFELATNYGTRLLIFQEGKLIHDLDHEDKLKLSSRDIIDLCGYL